MIFDDPFSLDFLSSTTNIREQSLALLKPVKPVKAVLVKEPMTKFYMHKSLKDRLLKLIETYSDLGEESPIIKIASALLAINKVPVNQINYLGLSQEDFTKISYLVPERVERARNRKYVEAYVTRKTKVIIQSIIQTTIPVKNNSDLLEDAAKEFTQTYHERVINFSDETFEEYNGEIPLVRKKIYNHDEKDSFGAPTYTESFVLPLGTFTFKESPYYHIVDNKLELAPSFTGRELVDYWLTNVKFVHLLGCWDPSLRHHQTIHKVLNRIFGDKFTEREKNLFSEAYFKLVIPADPSITFSIISKEMSAGYYYGNYFKPENDSPLWKSCMRHAECVDRDYFALYEEIPECKLAILKKDEKIVARCLLWELDTKYYDRIYYYNDTYFAQLEKIVRNLGYTFLRHSHSAGTTNTNVSFEVDSNLVRGVYNFPYVDSFRFYILDEELLTTEEPSYGVYYKFDDTDGSFEVVGEEEEEEDLPDPLRCSCCDDIISENGYTDTPCVFYVGRGPEAGTYCCESCVNYSEAYDTDILATASTFCNFEETYILDYDFVDLYDGERCYKNHSKLRETEDGYYFVLDTELAELFVEIDDKWYLAENLEKENEEETEEAFETQDTESSELPPPPTSIEIPEVPTPPNIDLF